MALQPDDEDRSIIFGSLDFRRDSNCYNLGHEIWKGVNTTVYKASCLTLDSFDVAIKLIDLKKSRHDFQNVKHEENSTDLFFYPNILKAFCSFKTITEKITSLWVVMPFIPGGSLQSIVSSSFPDGLKQPYIAAVLKEVLIGLSYLHRNGHPHRDIKAGNILVDSYGKVMLADFGFSASFYEWSIPPFVTGTTPYWMAPEVIEDHKDYGLKADIWSFGVYVWFYKSNSVSSSSRLPPDVTGNPRKAYSLKADIWSLGITALELAHGRPPLSHLPPSKSLMKDRKGADFSKSFKDMVGLCLDRDPSRRPTAEDLLNHSVFNNCEGNYLLLENLVQGLPALEERAKISTSNDGEKTDDSCAIQQRKISGWKYDAEGFVMEPVYSSHDQKEADHADTSVIQEEVQAETESFSLTLKYLEEMVL